MASDIKYYCCPKCGHIQTDNELCSTCDEELTKQDEVKSENNVRLSL